MVPLGNGLLLWGGQEGLGPGSKAWLTGFGSLSWCTVLVLVGHPLVGHSALDKA